MTAAGAPNTAQMTRSATDRGLGRHDQPNELLMWHSIPGVVKAGGRRVHPGESDTSETRSRKKERYRGQPHDKAEHPMERIPATAEATLRWRIDELVGSTDR